jgi:hypothetical protein
VISVPPIIEINGYDETGIIGRNLRFVRVGMDIKDSLRPFVYNLLHFRSVSATKRFLGGISDAIKVDYVKKAMNDPAISVTQYSFSTDLQIDILRKFTLLEEKNLFSKRGDILYCLMNQGDLKGMLEDMASYLKRYDRSPYRMESFIKSYGFRMIIEDLQRSSSVLKNRAINDYRIVSYVDGGFPFVFWWRTFLAFQDPNSRFSLQKTPIYGVTKGDEYYPATSMAGNIAFISSCIPGIVYPHNIVDLPEMDSSKLNEFYNLFSQTTDIPTFHKRVLFVGSLYRDFQYLIPFILHLGSDYQYVFEPFRLQWKNGGTLKAFYRTFGRYPENDIVVVGPCNRLEDKEIAKECAALDLDCQNAADLLDVYNDLLDKIEEQSEASNLTILQKQRISQSILFAKQKARESVQ